MPDGEPVRELVDRLSDAGILVSADVTRTPSIGESTC